ncbi:MULTISPECIES: hypothetical protein [Nostoc]|uniref:Helix-turn-helix type 11 domain-containing protein n=2 Tax=Nostoc TaxID=1177 RepID=A0ABR8IK27_9NOSO|nr:MULTISPECIES: hypothetical protein [Nostoc]MBD2565277.1 hypothetical protein [Nostoc linckia FACHB-391]MBD2651494.1 hypothetical protein [Nostoc foliaceum FACHB-393]
MIVADFNQIKTKNLATLLPSDIDGLSSERVRELLNISRITCWRYLKYLLLTQPKNFDFISGNQYYSRGTIEALFQFQQLVERFQYEGAVSRIKNHMEDYYELQESNR